MIHSFKHKGLKAFASNGTTTGINPSHAKKLRKLLGTLQQVRHLGELSNGFGLHRNSRRKPPNSFGWRNAALIHTRKRPCAGDAHFATLC